MKKFAKILTVFLAVCLLVGTFTATVVSADDEASTPYTVVRNYNDGGADTINGESSLASLTTATGDTVTVEKIDANDKLYTRFSGNATSTSKGATYIGYRDTLTNGSLDDISYVVWDFDFAAESGEDDTLSYPQKYRFYHSGFGSKIAYIVKIDNVWYVADNHNSSITNKIQLADKAGEWNHFTLVADIENNKCYMFVNGQWLRTDDVTITKTKATFMYVPSSFTTAAGDFSMGIDNVTQTYFTSGYTTDNTKYSYGITDLLNETDLSNVPLYKCEDVVFNAEYKYDNAPESQVVATIDGAKYYYAGMAVKALEDPDLTGVVTIETRKSITLDEVSEDVDSFIVKCTDDATFSAEGFNPAGEADENGYVTYTKAVKVNATWYGTDGQQVAASEVNVGNPVEIPEAAAAAYAAIKGAEKYEWSTDAGFASPTEFDPTNNFEVPDGTTAIYIRPAVATVTWKGVSTDSLTVDDVVETWYKGSALDDGDHLASFSSYKETGIAGWTVLKYAAWDNGYVDGETTVNGDATYNPVKTLEAAVSYKANITLLEHYSINIYVPVPAQDSGITEVVFGNNHETTIDGSQYYQATKNSVDYRVSKGTYTATISFNVGDVTLTDTLTVSTLDYINKVINEYNGDDKEEAKQLVVNFANYIHQCAVFNGATETDYAGIVAANSTYLYNDVDGTTAASTGTGCAVSYKTWYSREGDPAQYVYLVLLVPKATYGNAPTVTANYYGIENNLTNQEIDVEFVIDGEHDLVTKEDTTNYNVYIMDSYAVYNLLATMTITVDGDGENDVTITHNFTDYIGYLESNSGDDMNMNLLESLYGFAKAAKEFKEFGKTPVEQQ